MKNFFIILLAAVAALTASAQERDDACVFEKFEYLATVHADNSWTVEETITANFLEERHGIYQYIELPFSVNFGGEKRDLTTDVTNINVVGDAFKVSSEDGGRYSVIRIGDADRNISGSHEYNINYTLHFFDDGCSGADMFYITVLGAQWKNDIREFSFNIKFDNPFPKGFADSLQVYSGKLGSTANELGVEWEVDTLAGCITGHASNIGHHNAITLRANLPEAYWDMTNVGPAPTPSSFYDNFTSWSDMAPHSQVLAVLTLLAFLAALVYLLTHRRRNPIVSVEYNAPHGISSAEMGYVIDNTIDMRDLSSLIVWWASRGYLTIKEEEYEKEGLIRLIMRTSTTIVLTVKKPLPDIAPDYQRKFWDVFFATSDTCRLKDLGDKHTEINEVKKSLSNLFTDDRKLMQTDKIAVGLIALFFTLAAAVLISSEQFLIPFVFTGISAINFWRAGKIWRNIKEKGFSTYFSNSRARVISDIIGFVLYGGTPLMICFFLEGITLVVSLGILLGGLVLVLLSFHTRQNTPYRMEMLSRILGFKEFIRAAEMPMLKAMVDENPSYFYDVLPYAIAFGLSDKWCKQFEGINIEAPDWYVCDGVTNLNMVNGLMVAQSLTDNFDKIIASSIQSSSGDPSSGGGGYSGGGGGGGGGGSW